MEGNVEVLTLAGEFSDRDVAGVRERFDELARSGCTRLVVNLSGARFISSSMLGSLIQLGRRTRDAGGEMVISDPSEFLRTSLTTLGLERLWKIFPDDASALGYFGGKGDGPSPSAVHLSHIDAGDLGGGSLDVAPPAPD